MKNLKTELSDATVKGNALVFQACIGRPERRARCFETGHVATYPRELMQKKDSHCFAFGRVQWLAAIHVPRGM